MSSYLIISIVYKLLKEWKLICLISTFSAVFGNRALLSKVLNREILIFCPSVVLPLV